MTELRAGIGRANITPPVGIAHAGWGAQTHERAAGIDLEFFVTVLVLADKDVACAIIDLDLGMVMPEEAEIIRHQVSDATSIAATNIRVSYTHTHAGPILGERRLSGGSELVGPYMETVRSQTIGAARLAQMHLQPVRVAAGYGSSDIAVNRRFQLDNGRVVCSQNPAGFTDDTVLVVRIDDLDERPLACVVGYACHPITLAFQNQLLSPDFPGVMRRVVESLTGATCLFLQGSAGDQMPIEALTGDPSVHRRLGTRLGAEAANVFLAIETRPAKRIFDRVVESGAPLGLWTKAFTPDIGTPLQVLSTSVRMPIKPTPPREIAEADVARALEALAVLRAAGGPKTSINEAMFRAKHAEMRLWWASWCSGLTHLEVEVHVIRVGPIALVGFPGEPFAEIGAIIRERSPLPFTQLAGYTNGWRGYVPTAEAFGEGGYEVELGTAFTAEGAAILIDATLSLLGEAASGSGLGVGQP